jgi:acyl-CoA thioesterase FadM
MAALASCIGDQLVDWRVLKREYRTTVVIVGVHLVYLRDFDFFSAPRIEVDAGLVVRRGGRFLELDCRLSSPDEPFAVLTVLNRPVRLSGTEALDATPADLDESLLARFQEDEYNSAAITRPVVDRVSTLERDGKLLAEGRLPFTVSRSDCEIADQWQNVRLPDWFACGRERLVFSATDPRVKVGLSEPISALFAEFRRPMYLGDEGLVYTRVYASDSGSLAFVHEIHSGAPGLGGLAGAYAVGIEEFSTGGWA